MRRIALIGDNSVEYIKHLIDIWNNGDCAVLIDAQTPLQTMLDMMVEAGVTACYVKHIINKG